MKVYAVPEEVPAPLVDYTNFDFKAMQVAEDVHAVQLKEHLIAMGYTGKNTGRILRIQHADGYAAYMYADVKGGSCLIHLPYGDAWDSPWSRSITQKDAIKRMDQADKIKALFASRAA